MAINLAQGNTPMTDEALPLKCTVSSYSVLKSFVVSASVAKFLKFVILQFQDTLIIYEYLHRQTLYLDKYNRCD